MAENPEMYELKKQLKHLKKIKGSGTELISLYISKDYPLPKITNKLREEQSQAANIKSKSTRNNVTDALGKILNYLKMFKSTPPKGIAIFCGNVSDNPGKTQIDLFSIVPPMDLDVQLYRCDSSFFLEPLERMVNSNDSYGIVAMDGREATIAIINGTSINIVKKLTSQAHSRIRAGGQSARRYERLIENSIKKYHKRIGEHMDRAYIGKKIKGVVVGGPGPSKEYFLKSKPFNYQIEILGTVDTGYTDEYGVREIINKSGNILKEQEIIHEKKLIDDFIRDAVTGGLVTYGLKEVEQAIITQQAGTLLVSEGLELKHAKLKCDTCGKEEFKTVKPDDPEISKDCSCGGKMKEINRMDLIDYLVDLANTKNIKDEIISTDSPEGLQFLKSFYGIGAILRYK